MYVATAHNCVSPLKRHVPPLKVGLAGRFGLSGSLMTCDPTRITDDASIVEHH
jgi:hypothetical protein